MPEFTLRITGPTAHGSRISGPLLRDLLGLVADGTRRALRLRVEGRSTAKGTPPGWLDPATSFDFTGLSAGSCIVHLNTQPLARAAPDTFAQGSLFLDHNATALGLWVQSLADAVAGQADSELFDASMLAETEANLARIFHHPVDLLEIRNGTRNAKPLIVRPEAIEQIQRLRAQTPPARWVRVAGRLDSLRHSDRRFVLILDDGSPVTGIAENIDDHRLSSLWGQPAVVSGLAVFRPSGALLRIEANAITPARPSDLTHFSEAPRPIGGELDFRALRKSQGPRSGINAIFGKWPGDETDEEFAALLGKST